MKKGGLEGVTRRSQEDCGGKHFHKYFAKPQMKQKHRWVDDSARVCSVSHKGKLPFASIYRVEEIKTTILYFFGITENISYTQTGTALCLIFLVSFPKVWHFPSKVCNSMVLKHTKKLHYLSLAIGSLQHHDAKLSWDSHSVTCSINFNWA